MEKNALKVITDAMLEKKGQGVVSLDLSPIGTAKMQEKCGRKVLRMQGLENDFWIILDYGDIVVHVFLTEYREFYRLEDLWADAERTEYTDEPVPVAVEEKRVKPKAASKVRASAKRVRKTETDSESL